MTFGEKLKQIRLSQNLAQRDLAKMTGISERSLYTYEQTGIIPRGSNLQKIAQALHIPVGYLMEETEPEPVRPADSDTDSADAKAAYAARSLREANEILSRAAALFTGDELDDDAKDTFFRALMEVYLESKPQARIHFSPKKRVIKARHTDQ